ncbi:MAG: hypothetical protein JST35_01795 [Armatimonadetes bacterium]|nr:hypothetical protein [Armatimonadota bacterium]
MKRIMTPNRVRALVVAALVGSLAGCVSSGDWVGTWTGKRQVVKIANPEYGGAEETIKSVKLIIHPDGRYELIDGGVMFEGQARRTDGEVELTPERIAGLPAKNAAPEWQKPLVVKRQQDGSASFQSSFLPGDPIRLSRISTTAEAPR